MRYFIVHYLFREGINGPMKPKNTVVTFDDVDPEITDFKLKQMARREVDSRFERSGDFPLYGKFWEITDVEEVRY